MDLFVFFVILHFFGQQHAYFDAKGKDGESQRFARPGGAPKGFSMLLHFCIFCWFFLVFILHLFLQRVF